MVKKLFLRKKLQADFVDVDPEHHSLKRSLGWFQLIVIGIGAIIGAGVFVITGEAAAQYAGPAVVISFAIASIICVLAGLCYAELAALIPIAGGSYSYTYVSLGEFPAWIIGWCLTGEYLFSIATVSVGWSGYFKSFLHNLGLHIPEGLSHAPLKYDMISGWHLSGSLIDLPAILLIFCIGVLIAIGIQAATFFTNIMVLIKISTVLLFVVVGFMHIDPANWTPFIPENTGHFGDYGVSGIFRGAGLVFFAYIGFDTVSTLAQDTKNPQRDLPRGILGSLILCTIAYIVVSAALTGIVSYKILNVPDPIAVALDAMGPAFFWVASIVKVAILAGLASVVLVQLLGQSRIFLAIGRDKLLPTPFAKVHPKTRSPVIATIVATLGAMILAGLFPVAILGQLVSMMTLFIFAIVCFGVWILRHTHPEFERPFKVPLVPWVPLFGILACISQMLFLPAVTWVQLIIWLILGLAIYFLYSIRHSKIRNEHTAAEDD